MFHRPPPVTGSRHVTVDTADGVRPAWVDVPGTRHAGSGATAPLVERSGRRVSATIGA